MPQVEGLRVERLTAERAEDAAAIHAKCFERGWPAADFRTYSLDRRCIAFVADLDGRALGLAVASMVGGEAEILTVATDPSARRMGAARALMSSVLRDLATDGGTVAFLEVGVTNKAAIGLYKSLGFEEVGKRIAYYQYADGREDALIMRRLID